MAESFARSAANLHKQYVWGLRYIDAPLLRDRETDGGEAGLDERLYYTQDGNFNVTALVNPAGEVVERYSYDAYGQVTVRNGAENVDPDTINDPATQWDPDPDNASDVDNRLLYCGYRFDPETGLYHVRHRYHHPTLGRWTTRDPLGYVDGMGLYEYVRSSTSNHGDPFGLKIQNAVQVGRYGRRYRNLLHSHIWKRQSEAAASLRRTINDVDDWSKLSRKEIIERSDKTWILHKAEWRWRWRSGKLKEFSEASVVAGIRVKNDWNHTELLVSQGYWFDCDKDGRAYKDKEQEINWEVNKWDGAVVNDEITRIRSGHNGRTDDGIELKWTVIARENAEWGRWLGGKIGWTVGGGAAVAITTFSGGSAAPYAWTMGPAGGTIGDAIGSDIDDVADLRVTVRMRLFCKCSDDGEYYLYSTPVAVDGGKDNMLLTDGYKFSLYGRP